MELDSAVPLGLLLYDITPAINHWLFSLTPNGAFLGSWFTPGRFSEQNKNINFMIGRNLSIRAGLQWSDTLSDNPSFPY